MKPKFCQTENVTRFLAAVADVDARGAPEASIVLVTGDAGFGKSRAGQWWAVRNDAIFIRVNAKVTAHWVLADLVRELGEQAPARSCEDLFNQALPYLARKQTPIVIDEVEHTLKNDIRALEILRDLSDRCEFPLILIGREHVLGTLKRHRQLYTRISGYAEFSPATLADVTLCSRELVEVPVDDAVIAAIHKESEGHIREVVKALANVERVGRRNKGKAVTLEMIAGRPLCQEWVKTRRKAAA